jgi:hypothetical protein
MRECKLVQTTGASSRRITAQPEGKRSGASGNEFVIRGRKRLRFQAIFKGEIGTVRWQWTKRGVFRQSPGDIGEFGVWISVWTTKRAVDIYACPRARAAHFERPY